MTSFSGIATSLVDHLGVFGIGIGVFLNGLSVPGLSELLLPLGGVAVTQGRMNLVTLLVVAMGMQLLGVTCAYLLARFGGLVLVERYGKYILISHRELEAAQKLFEKYGGWLVVVGAFIPGIQGLVGYVAGIAQMKYLRFLIAVFVGKLVWIGGLVYLGSVLGDHIDLIDRWIKQIGVVVLAAMVLFVIWYVQQHRKRRKGRNAEGAKE
ncbi:MAG: associated Golgi protein-like protein [Patescibacteria group bacterium]|nr:associated Golgi protein-like protein [Patescibacteria group bacterium]